MPKKRETKPTWRQSRSRYFPDTLSGQTIDPMRIKLNQVVLGLNVAGDLKFLDSGELTQQMVTNSLIEWAFGLMDEKGAKALGKAIGPAMKRLEVLVAERMYADGKEVEPEYLPEGFSPPKVKRVKEPKANDTDE